jgi:hypothetical protein
VSPTTTLLLLGCLAGAGSQAACVPYQQLLRGPFGSVHVRFTAIVMQITQRAGRKANPSRCSSICHPIYNPRLNLAVCDFLPCIAGSSSNSSSDSMIGHCEPTEFKLYIIQGKAVQNGTAHAVHTY